MNVSSWIDESKIKHFCTLYRYIVKACGSQKEANDYIGFSKRVIERMKNGMLTADKARKILDAYFELKSIED